MMVLGMAGWSLAWYCFDGSTFQYIIGLPFVVVYSLMAALFCDCDKWI